LTRLISILGIIFLKILICSVNSFNLIALLNLSYSQLQSINDVITGTVLYGSRLYMQEISHKSSREHSTAIVLHNTRATSGYKSVQEMIKPDSDAPWGNRITCLYVPIPKILELKSMNPLEFVLRAHKIIKKQRNSSLVYFNSSLLTMIDKLRGPEVHI
jgi:hypothetical protein